MYILRHVSLAETYFSVYIKCRIYHKQFHCVHKFFLSTLCIPFAALHEGSGKMACTGSTCVQTRLCILVTDCRILQHEISVVNIISIGALELLHHHHNHTFSNLLFSVFFTHSNQTWTTLLASFTHVLDTLCRMLMCMYTKWTWTCSLWDKLQLNSLIDGSVLSHMNQLCFLLDESYLPRDTAPHASWAAGAVWDVPDGGPVCQWRTGWEVWYQQHNEGECEL